MLSWHEHLDNMICSNEQVKLLNEVLLNIYSNFIPKKVKTINPRQAPQVEQTVKNIARKESYLLNCCEEQRPHDQLEAIQMMRFEGEKLAEEANQNYFLTLESSGLILGPAAKLTLL